MRESAAILSKAKYFIGPDSLLMHIANGLNIPSTIIFGGSRPVGGFGYSQNINLSTAPECSPCWIHEGYEICKEHMKCMEEIALQSILEIIGQNLLNLKH
jgi:ADP-heptose:LPS heptosyltransferase